MRVKCYCGRSTSDGIVKLCHYHMIYRRIDGSPMTPRESGSARLQTKQEHDIEVAYVDAKTKDAKLARSRKRKERYYAD